MLFLILWLLGAIATGLLLLWLGEPIDEALWAALWPFMLIVIAAVVIHELILCLAPLILRVVNKVASTRIIRGDLVLPRGR